MEISIDEQRERIIKVKALVQEVHETHRYSMSRIYSLSNEIFGKNEKPQSCASCLIRKVKELETWLSDATKENKDVDKSKRERKEG